MCCDCRNTNSLHAKEQKLGFYMQIGLFDLGYKNKHRIRSQWCIFNSYINCKMLYSYINLASFSLKSKHVLLDSSSSYEGIYNWHLSKPFVHELYHSTRRRGREIDSSKHFKQKQRETETERKRKRKRRRTSLVFLYVVVVATITPGKKDILICTPIFFVDNYSFSLCIYIHTYTYI